MNDYFDVEFPYPYNTAILVPKSPVEQALGPVLDIVKASALPAAIIFGAMVLTLLMPEPKRARLSGTRSGLSGLSGRLNTCAAYQEVQDKRGKTIHRCFIYEPTCQTKSQKCLKETYVVGASIEKEPSTASAEKKGITNIFEHSGLVFGEKQEHLGGGTFTNIYVKIGNDWKFMESKRGTRQFSKKDLDRISENARGQFNIANIRGLSGDLITCNTYAKVKDKRGRLVNRCIKYLPTCESRIPCRSELPPKTWLPEKAKPTSPPSEAEIKSIARMLADEANQSVDDANRLYREIISRGGIAPHKKGFLREEYADIPTKYHRASGLTIDEMADELKMPESELLDEMWKAKEVRKRLPKGKSRFSVDKFIRDAEDVYYETKGKFAGLGFRRTEPKITPELSEKMKIAERLGEEAFEAGKKAIPFLDKKVMTLQKDLQIGQGGDKIFDAWIKGWTKANLRAPLPSRAKIDDWSFTRKENRLERMRQMADKLDEQEKKVIADRVRSIADTYEKGIDERLIEKAWQDKFWKYDERHEMLIKEALAQGKKVPYEVLKDYPELAPKKAGQLTLFGRLRGLGQEQLQLFFKPKAKPRIARKSVVESKEWDPEETKRLDEKHIQDVKKKIRKDIYRAYNTGGKVPYDFRTLLESGVSVNVIRKVTGTYKD